VCFVLQRSGGRRGSPACCSRAPLMLASVHVLALFQWITIGAGISSFTHSLSCRQPMPTAHVLRMTHVGLGGQQLDKVQVALEAASNRVQRLDLSSESCCSGSCVFSPTRPVRPHADGHRAPSCKTQASTRPLACMMHDCSAEACNMSQPHDYAHACVLCACCCSMQASCDVCPAWPGHPAARSRSY
jgi:hypothetical protein